MHGTRTSVTSVDTESPPSIVIPIGFQISAPTDEEIAKQILSAAPYLIVYRRVRLQRTLKDSQPMPTGLCPKCGESYPLNHGGTCPSCQGEAYYDLG